MRVSLQIRVKTPLILKNLKENGEIRVKTPPILKKARGISN
jgi:hypothetical protein